MSNNCEEKGVLSFFSRDYDSIGVYDSITKEEGEPFTLEPGSDGESWKVHFNENWNAKFLQELDVFYEPDLNCFRFHRGGKEGTLCEFQVCALLSCKLANYWIKWHPKDAKYLLPRRDFRMLRDSVKLLKGLAGL